MSSKDCSEELALEMAEPLSSNQTPHAHTLTLSLSHTLTLSHCHTVTLSYSHAHTTSRKVGPLRVGTRIVGPQPQKSEAKKWRWVKGGRRGGCGMGGGGEGEGGERGERGERGRGEGERSGVGWVSRSMGSFHTSVNKLVQPNSDEMSRKNTQITSVT